MPKKLWSGALYVGEFNLFAFGIIPFPKRFDAILRVAIIVGPDPTVQCRCEQIEKCYRQSAVKLVHLSQHRAQDDITSSLRFEHDVHVLGYGCIGTFRIGFKVANERKGEIEFSRNLLPAVLQRPPAKRFLDELYGVIVTEPVAGIGDTCFEQRKTQPGSRLDAERHLVSWRNAIQTRNRKMGSTRYQASGGSHPAGAARNTRRPRRCAEIACSNIVLAAIQSGHCLYLSRIVCCERCWPSAKRASSDCARSFLFFLLLPADSRGTAILSLRADRSFEGILQRVANGLGTADRGSCDLRIGVSQDSANLFYTELRCRVRQLNAIQTKDSF